MKRFLIHTKSVTVKIDFANTLQHHLMVFSEHFFVSNGWVFSFLFIINVIRADEKNALKPL